MWSSHRHAGTKQILRSSGEEPRLSAHYPSAFQDEGGNKYSSRQHLCATTSLLAWCDVRSVQPETQTRRCERVNTHEWFSAYDFGACSRSDSCMWRRPSDASKRNSHGLPENQDDSSFLLLV